MSCRLDTICHTLYKDGKITFNEWVVITSGVSEWAVNPVLPKEYRKAKRDLLKEVEE